MILLLLISCGMAAAYLLLLQKYTKLWEDISKTDVHLEDVQLIIALRNEEENLKTLFKSLNDLNFPVERLNILFVNDHSEDASVKLIEASDLKYPYELIHLYGVHGKKEAIKASWQHVKADLIVQTDADCSFNESWLEHLIAPFADKEVQFVSGPVIYQQSDNFWKALIAQDFHGLIAIGAAHIQWNKAMICNGANMAYRSARIKDLDLQEQKASGDDVFLLQSIALTHPNGIRFAKDQEATVTTKGPESFGEFWHQRLRWASKNTNYSSKFNTRILVFTWLFNVLILVNLLSFYKINLVLAAFMLTLKLLGELSFFSSISTFFGSKKWVKISVYGQLFHVVYITILPIASKILKYKWKERKLQ